MSDTVIEGTTFLNIEEEHYNNSYKRLCPSPEGMQKKNVVFPTMWELFVWSAILGYSNKCPRKLGKRYANPPFRWQVIKANHQQLLFIMAVENHGNFEILKDRDRLKNDIEEHSNGGLYLMHKSIALDPLAYRNMESLIYEIQERIKVSKDSQTNA